MPGLRLCCAMLTRTLCPDCAAGKPVWLDAVWVTTRMPSQPYAACRSWVAAFEEEGNGLPGQAQELQPLADQLLDTVMLSLRLADGLDLAAVAARHGGNAADHIQAALQPHLDSGRVSAVEQQRRHSPGSQQCLHSEQGRLSGTSNRTYLWPCLRLTDPGGFLVSNDIISDVFAALTPD